MWYQRKDKDGKRISGVDTLFGHVDTSDWNFLKILHQEILEEENQLAQLNLSLDKEVLE